MPFEMDDPRYLNRRLCSVEIYVPSQLSFPDHGFEMYCSTWFGAIREDIQTANGMQSITFGVHSAFLAIETCDYSRIEQREGTRYKSTPLTLAFEHRSEKETGSKREGSFGAGLSAPLLNILKLRGEGSLSAVRNVTNAESKKQDSTFDVFEVETASPWEWRIQAVNPARPVPRLNGAELSDVPLCGISTPKGTATVSASVSISALDLWLDCSATSGSLSLEDEANQNAVLAALLAKSIETSSDQMHHSDEGGEDIVVASSTLHRRKPKDDT
ncbi:MAG: hypothetical protein AAFQ58_23370 [Pseudomonadota bacterium]